MLVQRKKLTHFIVLAACAAMGLAGCAADSDDSTGTVLAVVANTDDNTLTIIDASTLAVQTATVALSGTEPTEIIAGSNGLAYVLNFTSNDVSIVDVVAGTELSRVGLSGVGPVAGVIAPDGFLYIAFDASALVSRVDIAISTPAEDSTIAITPTSATAIGVTNDGTALYVADAGSMNLSKVDVATRVESGTFAVGANVTDIVFHTDGLGYLATDENSEEVLVFNPATDIVDNRINFATSSEMATQDIAFSGNQIFLALEGNDSHGGLVELSSAFDATNFDMDAGDDDSYAVTLPFAFNFLGTDYTDIETNSNGVVAIDGSYVDYDEGIENFIGFSPNNEDLDSGNGNLAYSSRVFPDHAVFQWSTSCNDDEPSPAYATTFEVVLFDDGRARFDYLTSGASAVGEDDDYNYGVGNNAAVADLRGQLMGESPFNLERRSFAWNPATPSTFTEVDFTWEGTGIHFTPIDGQVYSVAATSRYVFSTRPVDYDLGGTVTVLDVLDRETMLPVAAGIAVGNGPTAVELITID